MATILIIDDQPDNRDVLVTLLGYSGYRLLEANDGLEGLTATRTERPDLIITDIRMPRMDGFEFVRHLRDEPAIAAIPVIFYSATYRLHEVALLAHACGVAHLLPKPSEPQAILDIVAAALGRALHPLVPLPREEFDRQHLQLLTNTLARHVTTLEENSRRLRTMIDLGQELAAEHDTLRLLGRACHLGRELVGAQYALLGIVDADGQYLTQVMTSGLEAMAVPSHMPLAPQSVLGDLLTHGFTRCLHALPGDPQVVGLPQEYPPVHSFLGAPLMTGERVYGCLCLFNTCNTEGFSAEDEQITLIFTMQAALAYENARRYDAIEHYVTQLEQEVVRREFAEEGLQQATNVLEQRVAERTAALQEANEQLATRASQLEQRHHEVTILSELGSLLQSCLTVEEAYTVIAQCCQRLFPEESGALYIFFGASRHLVETVTVWGTSPVPEASFAPEECWALRRGRLYVVTARHANPQCLHTSADGLGTLNYLCIPLMAQGQALGVLHLRSNAAAADQPVSRPEPLSETTQRLAEAVVEHMALALANVHLRQTLHIQSTRDPLTGLFNRRYMEESLEREIHHAVRHEQPIGLLMLDIDHFKCVNDVYGHDAGDVLLRALGQLLAANSRAADIACRYGGEEFLLILPNAPLAVMAQRAERLRVTCKHLRVQYRGQELKPVTLSLGIAVFPEHGSTSEALLRVADTALYRAKAAGRNRVVIGASPEEGAWPPSL